jgi:quinolinate synthase
MGVPERVSVHSSPSGENPPPLTPEDWEVVKEIIALKKEKNALLLAHNYQVPIIQEAADFVGDSLGLAREAQKVKDKERIVFCGVHFMAETAKILNPERKVLIPDPDAGCSLVNSISVEALRKWKEEHPSAVVVGYVNTTAEVKAECDYCCTSANAVKVIESIPPEKEILFLPDMFLGAYIKQKTGRKNIHIWPGECHVHAGITPKTIETAVEKHPNSELFVHPECGCSTNCMYLSSTGALPVPIKILSTSGMVKEAEKSPSKEILVATEIGILHQLRKRAQQKKFIPVSENAICEYMKMITPEKVLRSLREDIYPVEVPEEVRKKALKAIQRMVEIG